MSKTARVSTKFGNCPRQNDSAQCDWKVSLAGNRCLRSTFARGLCGQPGIAAVRTAGNGENCDEIIQNQSRRQLWPGILAMSLKPSFVACVVMLAGGKIDARKEQHRDAQFGYLPSCVDGKPSLLLQQLPRGIEGKRGEGSSLAIARSSNRPTGKGVASSRRLIKLKTTSVRIGLVIQNRCNAKAPLRMRAECNNGGPLHHDRRAAS